MDYVKMHFLFGLKSIEKVVFLIEIQKAQICNHRSIFF